MKPTLTLVAVASSCALSGCGFGAIGNSANTALIQPAVTPQPSAQPVANPDPIQAQNPLTSKEPLRFVLDGYVSDGITGETRTTPECPNATPANEYLLSVADAEICIQVTAFSVTPTDQGPAAMNAQGFIVEADGRRSETMVEKPSSPIRVEVCQYNDIDTSVVALWQTTATACVPNQELVGPNSTEVHLLIGRAPDGPAIAVWQLTQG